MTDEYAWEIVQKPEKDCNCKSDTNMNVVQFNENSYQGLGADMMIPNDYYLMMYAVDDMTRHMDKVAKNQDKITEAKLFNMQLGKMSTGMQLLYGMGILGILGGVLYYLVQKLNKKGKKDKKKKNKSAEKTD